MVVWVCLSVGQLVGQSVGMSVGRLIGSWDSWLVGWWVVV